MLYNIQRQDLNHSNGPEVIRIAYYVIADIHGEYDLFTELLDKIALKDSDTLFILGDVFDRGPHPVKTLLKLMEMPNVVPILGNHELMALECLEFLCREITNESLEDLDQEILNNLATWQFNGSETTIAEFRRLDPEMQQEVIEFIKEFEVYEEVSAGGNDYLLVHAGLGHFRPDKDIEDYTLEEIVWNRVDYRMRYYDDVLVVSGHTPTQIIEGNPRPGYIYRANNHIAIDCGACFPGGRLAALCLDTGEEFYSSENPGRS